MTIPQIAIYAEHEPRTTFELSAPNLSRGVMTLPEELLEQLLVRELARRGVSVEWHAHLSSLSQSAKGVSGHVTHYYSSGAQADLSAFQVDFVIGADGAESTVRRALGIERLAQGAVEHHASFDARLAQPLGHGGLLSFEDEAAHSAYPLREGHVRFTFEVEARPGLSADANLLRELLSRHLPWLGEDVELCSPGRIHRHRPALASSFGVGRIWLAGDAVHGTSPLGGQDLNVGLSEASELSLRMVEELKRPRCHDFGQRYAASRLRQWRELLSLDETGSASERVPNWTRRHATRLISTLPASERDLEDLLRELAASKSSGRIPLGALS